MKIILNVIAYLLVSNSIAGRTLAREYGNFDCKKTNYSECPTIICESHSNEKSTLPLDSIPQDTCSLTIQSAGDASLVITSADTFHEFEKLQNLDIRLRESFEIAENLLNSTSKEKLAQVVFDIPNLKNLSIEYSQFNSKGNSWMLPASLENLHLSRGVLEFDLRNCSRLKSVRLNYNGLSKMPPFHNPLPIEKLDLRHNPLDEFMVIEIAGFCDLKYFALDAIRIIGCECKRLKEWITESKKWPDFTFEGSLNCNDTVGISSNCTLGEALLIREKCWEYSTLYKAFFFICESLICWIIILLICCGLCCFCCYYIYIVVRNVIDDPETKARRRKGQPYTVPPIPPDAVYPRQIQPQEDLDEYEDAVEGRSRRMPPGYGYGNPY